jgi:hypothetical protein
LIIVFELAVATVGCRSDWAASIAAGGSVIILIQVLRRSKPKCKGEEE